MFRSTFPTVLCLGLAAVGTLHTASAQADLESQELALRRQLNEARKELISARAAAMGSIRINGTELPRNQIRRELIYLVGAKKVEAKIADFFIQEYLEQAIAKGRSESDFKISEDELTKDLQELTKEFREKNPGIDFWEAVEVTTGFAKEEYLLQQRKTKLFDRVFFPGSPQDWPDITREAIKASTTGGDGQQFWDNLVKAATNEESGETRDLPAFWMQLCRQWVQKQLKSWSDIQYPSDGLPSDVVLRVNGRDWDTEEAFEFVKTSLYPQDIERAMKEVVIREALRQELAAKGFELTDEEFQKQFAEYSEPYEGTPFTVEVIAVAFKGYPSFEAFRGRWRLMRGYENMIADEFTDENLQKHADEFARFFSEGPVQVDVIPFLARDLKTGGWVTDGMAKARDRAVAAMTRIKQGADFDEVLTSEGEFFQNDKDRGRLGSKSLNQLRQILRENEFTELLTGYSIGSYLFYEAPVGQIVGPLEGPDGFYIARVNNRLPARGKPSIAVERTKELVRQDYLSHRFLEWANEVLAKTEIE